MFTKSQVANASSVPDMLREDHKKVKGLFEEFEQADEAKAKQRIVETALMELDVHAKVEEELIYPAIWAAIDDDDLMDEALESIMSCTGCSGNCDGPLLVLSWSLPLKVSPQYAEKTACCLSTIAQIARLRRAYSYM